MEGFKIHSLVCSPDGLMIVFYTHARSWQFRIAIAEGSVLGEEKIFYSPIAA
jgi:hypothetical protein